MSERDVYSLLGGMSLGIALIGVGVIAVSWVTVAYCRIAKWRIRRTLDREIPLAAAFLDAAKFRAEAVRLQATIAAVQSLVAPIISAGIGKIGTHYETCYEHHAGCLAVYVADVIEEGAE